MSVHAKIDKYLASLESYDKDERYMGTSDLCNLLQTGIALLSRHTLCSEHA